MPSALRPVTEEPKGPPRGSCFRSTSSRRPRGATQKTDCSRPRSRPIPCSRAGSTRRVAGRSRRWPSSSGPPGAPQPAGVDSRMQSGARARENQMRHAEKALSPQLAKPKTPLPARQKPSERPAGAYPSATGNHNPGEVRTCANPARRSWGSSLYW